MRNRNIDILSARNPQVILHKAWTEHQQHQRLIEEAETAAHACAACSSTGATLVG